MKTKTEKEILTIEGIDIKKFSKEQIELYFSNPQVSNLMSLAKEKAKQEFNKKVDELKEEFNVSYKQVWGITQIQEIIDKIFKEEKLK